MPALFLTTEHIVHPHTEFPPALEDLFDISDTSLRTTEPIYNPVCRSSHERAIR